MSAEGCQHPRPKLGPYYVHTPQGMVELLADCPNCALAERNRLAPTSNVYLRVFEDKVFTYKACTAVPRAGSQWRWN